MRLNVETFTFMEYIKSDNNNKSPLTGWLFKDKFNKIN